jgi:hypothetical protein
MSLIIKYIFRQKWLRKADDSFERRAILRINPNWRFKKLKKRKTIAKNGFCNIDFVS